MASAQTNGQLWTNITLDWVRSARLTYELDVEPKVLVFKGEDDPRWFAFDVTPNVEYAVRPWLDAIGEVATGWTAQSDDVNSFEASPRAGVRLHLLSGGYTARPGLRERVPRRRVIIRDLIRAEWRNLFYSDDLPSESTGRMRNRLELIVTLNRDTMAADGARYLFVDWEWFMPFEDLTERFANKQRVRTGLGFRHSRDWRFDIIYMWTRSRTTADETFSTSDHIIDFRVKRVFQ